MIFERMKKLVKSALVGILGWQVRRLRKKNHFKVVAVAGSIGKTSTKFAVAQVLSTKFRVRYQEGNYNDISTVPLVFFGLSQPALFNPIAWAKTLLKIEQQLRQGYNYDVVIVEVGTDGPGQIKEFSRYLVADITVLTAITPEHMEHFGTLDAVAEEELTIASFSNSLVVNKDLCDTVYLEKLKTSYRSFGFAENADYKLLSENSDDASVRIVSPKLELKLPPGSSKALIYSISAATITGALLGMTSTDLQSAGQLVKPVKGRGMLLEAVNESKIIDETYNASPDAVISALDTLYAYKATKKIALLGNMNELGEYSEQAHREVGRYCDPKQIALVVTLGPDANNYLAEEAEKAGCIVRRVNTPHEAAAFIKESIVPNTLIIAKGSQNNVYAEEAVKELLANPEDSVHLVRQTPQWLAIKERNFSPNDQ